MKNLQGRKSMALLVALLVAALSFSGCDMMNKNNMIGPDATLQSESYNAGAMSLAKKGFLKDSLEVRPDKDAKLALNLKDIVKAEFHILKDNLQDTTWMYAERLGVLQNTFRISPVELPMPAGIEVELRFKKARLVPADVVREGVGLYQVVAGVEQNISTSVDISEKDDHSGYFDVKIEALMPQTGEVFLGGYRDGAMVRINGPMVDAAPVEILDPPVMVAEVDVYPSKDAELTLDYKNKKVKVYKAEFMIERDNVTDTTRLRLEKMGETRHAYQLTPMGISLPAGMEINIKFEDTKLSPFELLDDSLKIYQVVDGGTPQALPTEVKIKTNVGVSWRYKVDVSAIAYATGEFFLGARRDNGDIVCIDSEINVMKAKRFYVDETGSIELGSGTELIVPAGAISQDTTIGFTAVLDYVPGKGYAKGFVFGPHGMVFNQPIKLKLSFKEFGTSLVDLLYYNEQTGEWEPSFDGVMDDSGEFYILEIYHFSRYALVHG